MVVVEFADVVNTAFSLQVAVGACVATLLAYKFLFPSLAPHKAYAQKNGLTNITVAQRLPQSQYLLGDGVTMIQNMARLYDWLYEKTLEMNEQPWLRCVRFMPDCIMVTTPALIEDVVKTQNDLFGKGEFTRTVFDIVGGGFFVLDGDAWFHQRKTASKFFSAKMFRDVATAMFNKHADVQYTVLDKSSRSDEPVHLSKQFHELTLQSIAELGLGLHMNLVGSAHGHPLNTALGEILAPLFYRLQTPAWIWKLQRFLNVGGERKYRQLMKAHRERDGSQVTDAGSVERSRDQPTNIVELYIHAMQDDPTHAPEVSPETLRDIAIMFIFAGRDTTAGTLTWLFLMLHKHPEVEQTLRKELWGKVPELMRGDIQTLTMDQVQTLTFMDAVIKETLRLYAPGPLSMRQAERDTHLVDGTFVPKGAVVGLSAYALGRLESVWGDDALEFKRERVLDVATGTPRVVSSFAFFGFHAVPRVCIGKHLAILQLLIATLLSRYRLDVLENDGSYKIAMTLALKNPLMARIHPADPMINY